MTEGGQRTGAWEELRDRVRTEEENNLKELMYVLLSTALHTSQYLQSRLILVSDTHQGENT